MSLKEKIQKMKDNEIRLKVLKIRLYSLLRMPMGRRDENSIEKLREEITEIGEQLKKEETMGELEKKAKTGNFIKDLALRYDSAKEHLWVRLEDALVPEKKLEELTQRLQQIVDNYSLVDDHGVALVSKRKLEELLKEAEKG